jgi:hypothetical protein
MSGPPRLADRLLTRLLPTSRTETLVGDLHEQYQRGRSRGWYWRQVIEVFVLSLARDLRSHKLLTLRALALGWAMLMLCNRFVLQPLSRIDRWLFQTGLISHYVAWDGLVLAVFDALLVALVGAVCGWVVGWAHRACSAPIAFAFALSVGVYVTAGLGCLVYLVFVIPHIKFVYWPNVFLTALAAPLSVFPGGLVCAWAESRHPAGHSSSRF